jgi:hypothetical protein
VGKAFLPSIGAVRLKTSVQCCRVYGNEQQHVVLRQRTACMTDESPADGLCVMAPRQRHNGQVCFASRLRSAIAPSAYHAQAPHVTVCAADSPAGMHWCCRLLIPCSPILDPHDLHLC